MAGAVGGGGIGDLAITYGYQRFDTVTMMITVGILIVIVQGLQSFGNIAAKKIRRR
jgi:D-methionine transport system permease protein